MTGFFAALAFLTRLPGPRLTAEDAGNLGRAAPWLAVVGAVAPPITAGQRVRWISSTASARKRPSFTPLPPSQTSRRIPCSFRNQGSAIVQSISRRPATRTWSARLRRRSVARTGSAS